jgi:hypothetical protein
MSLSLDHWMWPRPARLVSPHVITCSYYSILSTSSAFLYSCLARHINNPFSKHNQPAKKDTTLGEQRGVAGNRGLIVLCTFSIQVPVP